MRSIQVVLQQNLGTGATGNALSITANVVNMSPLTSEIDKDVTKISQKEMTVEVADPDDSVWTFIQSSLTISSGVFPPYLVILVGNTQIFLGLLDTSNILRHQTATIHTVEFSAQSWDIELAQTYLGSPTAAPWKNGTPYKVYDQCYSSGSVYQCQVAGTSSSSSGGPSGIGTPITSGIGTGITGIVDGGCVWIYIPPTWQRPVPTIANNSIQTQTYIGYSAQYGDYEGDYGDIYTRQNVVYFEDPCGWVYSGATLEYDYPVFYTAVVNSELPAIQFPPGTIVADLTDRSQAQLNAAGNAWVIVPKPYSTALSGTVFAVSTATDLQPNPMANKYVDGTAPTYMEVTLSSSPWPQPLSSVTNYLVGGNWGANFTMANLSSSNLEYWTVMTDVKSGYVLPLNSVNGIVVGDEIGIVNSDVTTTWTVAGVDPTLNTVTTTTDISGVTLGMEVYWTEASQADMVMVDPITIMTKAIGNGTLDVSRFSAPTAVDPLFSWIPLQANAESPLEAIGDIESTIDGIKLSQGACWINPTTGAYMPTQSWTGTPGNWGQAVPASPTIPMVDWTSQLTSYPASGLMAYDVLISPNGSSGVAPWTRLRNRTYSDTTYRRENNGLIYVITNGAGRLVNGIYVSTTSSNGLNVYNYEENGNTYSSTNGNNNFTVWSPTGANIADIFPIYDYTTFRKITFNTTANAITSVIKMQYWQSSFSRYGEVSTCKWPSGGYVQDAVVFNGDVDEMVLAYVTTVSIGGTINGSAWRSATTTNDRLELSIISSSGYSTLLASIPNANLPTSLVGGKLVTTPFGVYLVGSTAIGQISYSGGTLSITTNSLAGYTTALFANTLTAIDEDNFLIFGRYDTPGADSSTETWMFRISTTIAGSLSGGVLWSEKICEGVPPLIGAVRDPSTPGRVVGHMGGSIWQVAKQRALCLDRFTPGGLTALELIEHICQYYSAIAVADAYGVMHIISRVNDETPILLDNINQTSIDTVFNWDQFTRIVQVNGGQDGSNNQYVFSDYVGGKTMTINNHPIVYSDSASYAMAQSLIQWFGVPRAQDTQEWFYPDPNSAAPFEALPPFALIQINGMAQKYRVMSISIDYIAGKATVVLLSD